MKINISEKVQSGPVARVLCTVDHLIIDRSITEEVKTDHRNLAVSFYDCKKANAKVYHDWMLRVYKWIGISGNVITLVSLLMRKWKRRLEILKDGKKVPIDGLTLPIDGLTYVRFPPR